MFYSSKPDELRAFLRDRLGFPFTDVGMPTPARSCSDEEGGAPWPR